MKRIIKLLTMVILILTALLTIEAGASDGVCYVGDNTEDTYATLNEAISDASAGDSIHLLDDVVLGTEGSRMSITKSLVIDGDNGEGEDFNITLVNNVQIINNSTGIKFTNTVIDLNGFHLIVTVTDKPCKFTLGEGAALENGGAVNGAAIETNRAGTPELEVVLDEGSVVRNCTATANGGAFFLNGGTLKINSGALIENCIATSGKGGAIHLQNQPSGHTGKLLLLGGTIENCSAGATGGAVNVSCGTLELSGDTVITDNKKGTNVNNITLPSGTDNFVLAGDFEGSVGITLADATADKAFGTVKTGVTGAENIICDTDEELAASVDDGILAFYNDGECYIGDNMYERTSIADAIATAPAGSVIHITKDASFGNSDGSRKTINKVLTFDGENENGDNYTLTFDSDIQIMNALGVKFENVTLNLDSHCFRVDYAAAKLIFGNGTKVTGGGSGSQLNGGAVAVNNGGVLVLEDGSEISDCESKANGGAIFINGGVVNIEDGALVKNCTSANNGGGICIQNSGEYTGTLTMSGGTIENCASGTEHTGGGIYIANGKIEISGEAYVQENKRGSDTFNNIYLGNGDILEVGESFVGAVGITFSMNSEGTVIGSAKAGNTGVTSVNSITSDAKNSVFGWINPEGKIIWQEKPTMTLQTDYGTYDEGTKGIIRVVTMFNVAPTTAKLSGFGTYILDNSAFSEEELKESENKFYKTEQSILASGKGFITDIHTGNLDKAYTVSSFCYIEGVGEPCFTTLQVKSVNTADDVKMLSDATVAEYRERYEN